MYLSYSVVHVTLGYPTMHYLQMSHFVGGHNDATKSTGILNDGHTVHLLQSLVHHARAADIGKACGTTKKQKMLTN